MSEERKKEEAAEEPEEASVRWCDRIGGVIGGVITGVLSTIITAAALPPCYPRILLLLLLLAHADAAAAAARAVLVLSPVAAYSGPLCAGASELRAQAR